MTFSPILDTWLSFPNSIIFPSTSGTVKFQNDLAGNSEATGNTKHLENYGAGIKLVDGSETWCNYI